jgi:tetratricopeptide (TPR) repeat protein
MIGSLIGVARNSLVEQRHLDILQQGYACQQQGDLVAAEKLYRAVLDDDAENEFALNLLGVTCIKSGRASEAIDCLSRAIDVNPRDMETHNNLGLAYKEVLDFQKAAKCFRDSLKLEPQQPETLNNLGNVLAAVDEHTQAIAAFKAALDLDERYVDCYCNLAVSLKEVNRLDHAIRAARRATALAPGHSRAHNVLGELFLRAAQYEAARISFERSIALDDSIVAKINLSTALKQLGEVAAAVDLLEHVVRVEPDNSEAHSHLGVLNEQLGNTAAAANHFRTALRHTPNHASSFYQLAKLKGQRLHADEVAKVSELLDDPATLDIFKSSLHFALACEAGKREDYDEEMRQLIAAQGFKAARDPYDPDAPQAYRKAAEQYFPLKPLEIGDRGTRHPVPIFVLGMPRSGTTLIEQIISSHSRITGAGELGFINDIVRRATEMTGQPFPSSIQALTDPQALELRNSYLDRLVDRFGHSQFIVDKNPLNFNLIGTIATLFPDAKIIYCRREPIDNCVSIFRLPFDDNQGYSHDLAALGDYYNQHNKLMSYWKSCYPKQILTVQYEDTVENLERQARRILEFVGAKFEQNVLNFFDNARIVMTPSASQVRQPIYKDSIAAWKRYEQHLGPLFAGLNGEVYE